VLIGGVNYYTGQVFDMAITAQDIKRSWVGPSMLQEILNRAARMECRFASWCDYKYEFGTWKHSGCFMHEKHHNATVPDLLDGGVTTRASLQDGAW
jgi:kynureninase